MSNPLIDETNNRYGALTVLSLTKDKNNRTAWLCKCDCGNTTIVRGPDLRKGKRTTCGKKGCYYKQIRNGNTTNEIGKIYGRLTVLAQNKERTPGGKIQWICQCNCSNKTIVIATTETLHLGMTKSCGCYSRDMASKRMTKDITGQRFGKLIALYSTKEKNQNKSYLWHCKCDCGNECDVPLSYLTQNNTKSCGCLISSGEEKIKDILIKNNIFYSQQYSFSNLVSSKNKKLRFDFAIFDDIEKSKLIGLIEYQGQQHYSPIDYFGGEETFKKLQHHDFLKKEYCKDNNIPLLEITYKDKDYEKILLDFCKKEE